MSEVNVTRVWTDDWEGYYINGKLYDQNHSIDVTQVFEELANGYLPSLTFDELEWDWSEDQLGLPENLDEVPTL